MEFLFSKSMMPKKLYLKGFLNVNLCDDKIDRRSTSSYLLKFQGSPISWCSKNKFVIALSSCEVEYVAGSLRYFQENWLQSIMNDLKISSNVALNLRIDGKTTSNQKKFMCKYIEIIS